MAILNRDVTRGSSTTIVRKGTFVTVKAYRHLPSDDCRKALVCRGKNGQPFQIDADALEVNDAKA